MVSVTLSLAPNLKTTSVTPALRPTAKARQQRRGGWRKVVPYGIGGGLLAFIVWGLLPKPVEVETAKISSGPLTVSVLEEGKTRIRHRYMISPPVSGFLNRIELRAGAPIEAGKTVLATIQPQPSSFLDPRARAESEARVQAATASKMRSTAQVERARAALDLAEKDRARSIVLKQKGAISARDWDTAENQVAVLTRELRALEFAQQVAEFELTQAQAALQQAVNPADEKAEPMKILAPVSGYVLNVMEENARVAAAGTAIMEVGDPADLEAEIELLSSDAVGVQPGDEVSIEQWGGDHPLRGKVTMIEPGGFTKISALGVEEQRVKVRVDFVDPLPADHPLGDRFRVEARIVTWHGDRVLQVPTGALFRRGSDWSGFVLNGGKARLTKVKIAHSNGTAAEIRSGLIDGQSVILHPPDAVADGTAVRARDR